MSLQLLLQGLHLLPVARPLISLGLLQVFPPFDLIGRELQEVLHRLDGLYHLMRDRLHREGRMRRAH
ncbi:MAG: hypothetical protein EHM23_31875 [Acidobacteria bacterium]|nr:MAG: hypothetical protein EHM23_31875 [Acidobacteriota bacterium]